jgi:hypothetical protein
MLGLQHSPNNTRTNVTATPQAGQGAFGSFASGWPARALWLRKIERVRKEGRYFGANATNLQQLLARQTGGIFWIH